MLSFFQALKNLIVINQSPMSIVDDYFIAYFSIFCNQQIDLLVKGVIGDYIVQIFIDSSGGNYTSSYMIYVYIYQIPFPFSHGHFLFLKWNQ